MLQRENCENTLLRIDLLSICTDSGPGPLAPEFQCGSEASNSKAPDACKGSQWVPTSIQRSVMMHIKFLFLFLCASEDLLLGIVVYWTQALQIAYSN